VRFTRLFKHARRINPTTHILPRVLPALILGLLADGLGQMIGYCAGGGRSKQKLAEYEFRRYRFSQDRSYLETAPA
jgi:hypothetical protein